MKQTITILFTLILLVGHSYGQKKSGSVYRNLKTKKFYSNALSFQFNDSIVSKSTYRKYKKSWGNRVNCYPCLLQFYDDNDKLMSEAVLYSEELWGVGWFKEYYPSGKLKLTGQYKENTNGNWEEFKEKGYFNREDGKWTYFKENGDTLYNEYWGNGEFIKQVPKQNKSDIWKIELTSNGKPIVNNQTISSDQIKELILIPKFKNNSTDSVNLTIKSQIWLNCTKVLEQTHTPSEFKKIDLNKLLLENKFQSTDNINFNFDVYNNGHLVTINKYVKSFYFNILNELPKAFDTTKTILDSTNSKSIDDYSYYLVDSSDSQNNSLDSNAIKPNIDFDYYLINSSDTSKKIVLIEKIAYDVNYSETCPSSLIDLRSWTINGSIENLNATSVKCEVLTETVEVKLKNGFVFWRDNDYANFDYPVSENLRNINLKSLNYISYSSPSRSFFNSLGTTVTFLSILTTAIVAPLASINYKNGKFNKDRFYSITGEGLIGLSVGIPLVIFTKAKTYKFTEKNSIQGKDLWYLESRIKR